MKKQITVFLGVLIHKKKILMLQRKEEEVPEAHHKWEFPGGKCEFDETPQEALTREFLEETGIDVEVKELLPFVQTSYWKYNWGTQQTLCFAFRCSLVKEGKRQNDHHVEDVKWFYPDEILKLDSLPGTAEVITIIKKRVPHLIS